MLHPPEPFQRVEGHRCCDTYALCCPRQPLGSFTAGAAQSETKGLLVQQNGCKPQWSQYMPLPQKGTGLVCQEHRLHTPRLGTTKLSAKHIVNFCRRLLHATLPSQTETFRVTYALSGLRQTGRQETWSRRQVPPKAQFGLYYPSFCATLPD